MSNESSDTTVSPMMPVTPAPPSKTFTFVGVEDYQDALAKAKQQLGLFVQSGTMSEVTMNRLVADYEYSFFNQLVKIKYE